MTQPEKFEQLKTNAMQAYADYLRAIAEFSYSDIGKLHNRRELLIRYNQSVIENARYRNFINNHKQAPPPPRVKQPVVFIPLVCDQPKLVA
jgi:hypothetical protein